MPLVKICCNEVTAINYTYSGMVTCGDPKYSPVKPGNEGNVCCYDVGIDLKTTPPMLRFSYDAQFEYAYIKKQNSEKDESDCGCSSSCTFLDYCNITGGSARVSLPDGVTLCPCGCGDPQVTCAATYDPKSITTTPTSVSGNIMISLTVTNLCVPTFVCVETEPCREGKIKYYAE